MTDLPRLTVTREQAEDAASAIAMNRTWGTLTLRLPERPTMQCPECSNTAEWCGYEGGGGPDTPRLDCSAGTVPIPEGTRVEVGWWELKRNRICGADEVWHPVAVATVAEVIKRITVDMDDDMLGEWTWLVTLTEIEEVQP